MGEIRSDGSKHVAWLERVLLNTVMCAFHTVHVSAEVQRLATAFLYLIDHDDLNKKQRCRAEQAASTAASNSRPPNQSAQP